MPLIHLWLTALYKRIYSLTYILRHTWIKINQFRNNYKSKTTLHQSHFHDLQCYISFFVFVFVYELNIEWTASNKWATSYLVTAKFHNYTQRITANSNALYSYTSRATKNGATLFLTITLFLELFLCFLYWWKQQSLLYKGVTKFTIYNNCLPTLAGKTKIRQNSRFWSQPLEHFIT